MNNKISFIFLSIMILSINGIILCTKFSFSSNFYRCYSSYGNNKKKATKEKNNNYFLKLNKKISKNIIYCKYKK